MSDRARGSVVVAAEPAAVMAAIADFPAYPEWVDAVRRAEVLSVGSDGRAAEVRFALDAGILKDDYVLAYIWRDDAEVRWHLVRSTALKAQDGSYTLRPAPGGTEVTYELEVELGVPLLGMFKRKAQQMIVDAALRGLKTRVESLGAA